MARLHLGSVILGLVVSTAAAQRAGDGWPDRRALAPAGDSQWFDRMVDRFARQLELDEEQRAEYRETAEVHRRRMEEVGQRWQEVREAMQAGDQARAAELRQGLMSGWEPGSIIADLLDEAEPLLRDDQLERLYEIQDRMEEQRLRMEMYGRLTRDMPEDLGLDEAQREQFEQILESQREQQRARWEEMRSRWEEMRAARESGDEARIEELRQELEELRPDARAMAAAYFDQVEQILHDDQKAILQKYREEVGVGGPSAARGSGDVRIVLRAARRVRIVGGQRDAFKQIEREAMKARREIRRRDVEGQARLAAKVRKQIVDLLDAEQTRDFEEHLERLERGARGRSRRPAGTP